MLWPFTEITLVFNLKSFEKLFRPLEQQFTYQNTIYDFNNYILGIKLPGKNGSSRNSEDSSAASSINGGKRKARAAATQVAKKMKKGWEVLESDSEESDKVRIGIWLNSFIFSMRIGQICDYSTNENKAGVVHKLRWQDFGTFWPSAFTFSMV